MIYIPIVHKSHVSTYKTCGRMSYYRDYLGLDPEFINEVTLIGTAGHNTIRLMHQQHKETLWKKDDPSTVLKYFSFFANNVTELKKYWLSRKVEVRTVQDVHAEDYAEIFNSYLSQDYNRYAMPVLMEAPFHFEIKRRGKVYAFEGALDQLFKIPIDKLNDTLIYKKYYPYTGYNERPYLYIHRDLKFGLKEESTSDWALSISDELLIYAYAMAFGRFDLDGDGKYETDLHHIPYINCLYFLRDLIQYKKATKVHVAGDYRGPAMYPTRITYDVLKQREGDIINLWKAINSGNWLRIASRDSQTCDRWCGHKTTCLVDLKGE